MNLLFIGPAGSGKTTLVWKFGNYLEKQGYEVFRMNLDCAAENLPYKPEWDIRKYFTLSEIMKKYHLGPNGALMKSVELIYRKKGEIRRFCRNKEFVLIDTPGQLELMIFHPKKISEILKGQRSVTIFLMPSDLIKTERDYYFLRFLDLSIKYRLQMPCIYAISKADLIKKRFKLRKVSDDLSSSLYGILKTIEDSQRLVYVSRYGKGFYDLYSLIREVFCVCGDLS